MARTENPPFSRGETFYNGGTITIDASTSLYGGYEHEGKIWEFEDLVYNQANTVGAKQFRTNRMVKCMAVRNSSGIALLPGRLASLKKSGVNYLGQVDGYGTTTAAPGLVVVDEWLPAAGVPNNDLFWAVVAGPTTVLSDIAAATATGVFNVGQEVVALTAVTSQATTAGRVAPQDVTSSATTLSNNLQNKIGYALSAATSGNTNSALLINVGPLPWAAP